MYLSFKLFINHIFMFSERIFFHDFHDTSKDILQINNKLPAPE